MSYTILVVDNEKSRQQMLASFIQHYLKYSVITAESSSEAAAYLAGERETKPTLVLVSFPSISMDFLRGAKRLVPEIPFIILSAEVSIPLLIEAMQAGACDFVSSS